MRSILNDSLSQCRRLTVRRVTLDYITHNSDVTLIAIQYGNSHITSLTPFPLSYILTIRYSYSIKTVTPDEYVHINSIAKRVLNGKIFAVYIYSIKSNVGK